MAYGNTFVAEAALSATHCRALHDLPCVLITDISPDSRIAAAFDEVLVCEFRRGYDDKILMSLSPFDETIFLDSDTITIGTIHELFDLLGEFDMAVQFTPGGLHYKLPSVPSCFTEPSAGIIVWKRSHKMDDFFVHWLKRYRDVEEGEGMVGAWDQRSLRWALWESNVRFCNIPAEYQFCLYKPEVCMGLVRMLHGRQFPGFIRKQINSSTGLRIYVPKTGVVPIYYESSLSKLVVFATRAWLVVFSQIIRRLLHHTSIMPFPTKNRPD